MTQTLSKLSFSTSTSYQLLGRYLYIEQDPFEFRNSIRHVMRQYGFCVVQRENLKSFLFNLLKHSRLTR